MLNVNYVGQWDYCSKVLLEVETETSWITLVKYDGYFHRYYIRDIPKENDKSRDAQYISVYSKNPIRKLIQRVLWRRNIEKSVQPF